MKISAIKEFPTTLGTGANSGRYHESVFRSYQTLEKVKSLLAIDTPSEVVLEIIQDIEQAKQIDKETQHQVDRHARYGQHVRFIPF